MTFSYFWFTIQVQHYYFLGVFVIKKHVLLALTICFLAVTSTACVSSDQSSKDQGTVSIKSSDDSSSKDSTKSDDDSSTDSKGEDGEVKQEADQVIYDDNDIKITYKGFSQAGLFKSASFDFLIENNSDKDITVTSKNVSVNDYSVSNFLYEEVAAGKKSNAGVDLYSHVLEENNIESIDKVEFTLDFSDPETYKSQFTSDKIVITLNENAEASDPTKDGKLLHEADGIAVYYMENTGGSWTSKDGLKFFVKNDTDKNIVVSSDDVSVNDFAMKYASLYADVEAGKKTNDVMDLYSTELEENGIDKVETVEFKLKCYDSDSYDDIWETDPITITLK